MALLETTTGKSQYAYIEQITEFLLVGYSYVLGKLCLYTITHWLKHRDMQGHVSSPILHL
jgi:hypothetical protein